MGKCKDKFYFRYHHYPLALMKSTHQRWFYKIWANIRRSSEQDEVANVRYYRKKAHLLPADFLIDGEQPRLISKGRFNLKISCFKWQNTSNKKWWYLFHWWEEHQLCKYFIGIAIEKSVADPKLNGCCRTFERDGGITAYPSRWPDIIDNRWWLVSAAGQPWSQKLVWKSRWRKYWHGAKDSWFEHIAITAGKRNGERWGMIPINLCKVNNFRFLPKGYCNLK